MGGHGDSAEHETPGPHCCPLYHEAVELIGRRWTGAIVRVLMDGPMRFSRVAQAVPELSDRLLSERMKELEARGIVQRTVHPGPPLRVEYQLSKMGSELEPALIELQAWANRWLDRSGEDRSGEDRSGEDRSGEDRSGEAPSAEAPSAEAPSAEAPSGEALSAEAPSGEAPSDGPAQQLAAEREPARA